MTPLQHLKSLVLQRIHGTAASTCYRLTIYFFKLSNRFEDRRDYYYWTRRDALEAERLDMEEIIAINPLLLEHHNDHR